MHSKSLECARLKRTYFYAHIMCHAHGVKSVDPTVCTEVMRKEPHKITIKTFSPRYAYKLMIF